MRIQAAAYGFEHLTFLADSVDNEDVSGLLSCLSKGGVTPGEKSDNENHQRIYLANQGTFAGNLVIASDKGFRAIESHTKLTLVPYLGKLRTPKFITGEIMGERPIREFLERYDVLVIEAIDIEAIRDYNARFSDIKEQIIRLQPQRDQDYSAAFGRALLQ